MAKHIMQSNGVRMTYDCKTKRAEFTRRATRTTVAMQLDSLGEAFEQWHYMVVYYSDERHK